MSEETIPQMREALDNATKTIKKLEEDLTKQAGENRRLQAREAFRTAGFKPEHGDLFASANAEAEISVETALQFANEYNLQPVEVSGGEQTPPQGEDAGAPTGSENLNSMSRAGSRAGEGGQQSTGNKTMTRQEWEQLNVRDPNAARQALAEGRVLIRADNPYAQTAGKTLGNPYRPSSE